MNKIIEVIPNKLLAIMALMAVIIVVLFGVDFYQKSMQVVGLNDSEILKASKEDIVDYKIQPSAMNGMNLEENSQGIVIYRYVSNHEVPAATYDGFREDLAKRTADSLTFLKSITPVDATHQREEYVAKFYARPQFQKSGEKWYRIETATTTKTAFFSQIKLTLLDQAKELISGTAMADYQIYAGAGDGFVSRYINSTGDMAADWATVHESATGNSADFNSPTVFIFAGVYTFFNEMLMRRGFFPFNTSSIPNSTVINNATLYLFSGYALFDSANDPQSYMGLVQTNQASSTILTTADYNKCGATSSPTLGADVVPIEFFLSSTSDKYIAFTLNSTGRGWIKRNGEASNCGTITGYTCLGIRSGHDIENIPASNNWDFIQIMSSEDTTGYKDPYLLINYTAPYANIRINGGTMKINGGSVKID